MTYQQRKFFDWGGWLAVRPMDELPHWRVIMRRERDGDPDCDPRIRKMGREHADAIDEMRAILRERGHREQPRLRDGLANIERKAIAVARTAPWLCTICGAPAK